ncbi:hypothetical protein ACJ73_03787 [Blastomyces percursus]|uniref:Uncharacterized protein n=1 Tax=Blastomyces percursus TaxID=1658174 RepID=A0A1J9RA33_9EURO|nr:hypothetical protein ACJ73_03787 [Blastomyces percursus]
MEHSRFRAGLRQVHKVNVVDWYGQARLWETKEGVWGITSSTQVLQINKNDRKVENSTIRKEAQKDSHPKRSHADVEIKTNLTDSKATAAMDQLFEDLKNHMDN